MNIKEGEYKIILFFSIFFGYSGGPVYDKEEKVIGVLNARYSGDLSKYDFDNLCAIIPINKVVQISDKIIDEN